MRSAAGRLATVVAVLVLCPGCYFSCGDNVWPSHGEVSEREATNIVQAEVGPSLPFTEVVVGQGRVVVLGRKLTLRANLATEGGAYLGSAPITVLFPEFEGERHGLYGHGLDSGDMPVYFGPVLAGMRVGGTRRFVMPRSMGGPWRLRSIDQEQAVEVASDVPVRVDLEVVDLCRPRICISTTFSIPASRERRAVELGCR
jgi:hypothetical protein